MGRNGCGKSTLLGLVAALHRPRAGTARVLGHDVSKISPYKLGRRVGLLLQNPDLMLCLPTVSKEVGFALVQRKLPPRQVAATTRELLQALGLGQVEDRAPHSLSQGQRLRVAVASLLAREVELLGLDEPTTGQDNRGAGLVIDVARKRQPQPTILIATHDVVSVARWADRVALLDQGKVLACGRTADVLGNRNLMTRIGVRPPPSLLLGEALGLGKTLTCRSFVEELTCKAQRI
jgi:energy-coupling factor transport system ATP-binding protein